MNSISSKVFRSVATCVLLPCSLLVSGQSFAEYFGMVSGRTANVSASAEKSVEAGFVTGDIAELSYQNLGVRFNGSFSPGTVAYLDIGQSEVDDLDGMVFGLGFIYQLDGILQNNDIAFKGSYHKADLESEFEIIEGGILSLELLISGQSMGNSDLSWYGNVGIHKSDINDSSETEIGFGGGVVKPTSFGEFYAGADLIDELTFGLGIRYFLQ